MEMRHISSIMDFIDSCGYTLEEVIENATVRFKINLNENNLEDDAPVSTYPADIEEDEPSYYVLYNDSGIEEARGSMDDIRNYIYSEWVSYDDVSYDY